MTYGRARWNVGGLLRFVNRESSRYFNSLNQNRTLYMHLLIQTSSVLCVATELAFGSISCFKLLSPSLSVFVDTDVACAPEF